MQVMTRFWPGGFVLLIPVLGFLAGCSSNEARFTPTSDQARASLETALTAWRDGQAVGRIEAKPPIQIADSNWQRGEKLESFQIAEEKVSGNGSKEFVVKLTTKGAKDSKDVHYFVNGRGPVWIFSEEDYALLSNMDGKPEPKSKAGLRRAGGRRR
jgi:hypothetical protein